MIPASAESSILPDLSLRLGKVLFLSAAQNAVPSEGFLRVQHFTLRKLLLTTCNYVGVSAAGAMTLAQEPHSGTRTDGATMR